MDEKIELNLSTWEEIKKIFFDIYVFLKGQKLERLFHKVHIFY